MTLAFGALTNAFTDFGTVAIQAADLPNGQALFDEAKAELFRAVDKSVLYFVYIAVGVFVATYIYTASFICESQAACPARASLTPHLAQTRARRLPVASGNSTCVLA